ncbi:Rrf2 family transcriptional regulator [Mitsuaria sp. GD03876]|uniref:RrF2 family transcriptional regulator n=1 Tax=Mitsuaria sp. GD03876 TaxID=2975399 RepID=UPI00244770C2|nr:Rrf2 family transcriptional regulator [Mitsuaria sp. GD03876]MDH0867352.1 Rrf2 family transcriptional regulator [Mitsuaria sp. GD03876]
MSFIGTGVEYGLHCLLHLVDESDEGAHAGVRALAELQGVSGEYLAKLFTKLAKAELVVAAEGAGGGYRLARPADRITVHDVVVAIEGDKSFFDCREIRSRCAVFDDRPPGWATRGVCSIHAVMQTAEKAMRDELKRHTLADLAERTDKKAPAAYKGQVVAWLSDRAASRRS